jgi:DNA-binding transcriptional ArsR family regulator
MPGCTTAPCPSPSSAGSATSWSRPSAGARSSSAGSVHLRAVVTLRITRIQIQVMRSAAPALLPIFRSRLQADILAALLLNPDNEHSLTELARRLHAPLSTVHGEVRRLTDAGLLRRREVGRSALVRANTDNRLVKPLAELLLLSWGPLQVVAEEFAGLDGAEQVMIFGSWAARYRQRLGKPPHDLDVLVVGRPSREDVHAAADRAQQRLGMPVNPVVRTEDAWHLASDPLVRQIQSSPLVTVLVPDDNRTSGPIPGTAGSGDA